MFSSLFQSLCTFFAGVPVVGELISGLCGEIVTILTSLGL